MTPKPSFNHLNTLCEADFVAALGAIFEHAPWVAETACRERPFSSLTALHWAMFAAIEGADEATKIEFLNAHPKLSPKSLKGRLTAESRAEQKAAGISEFADKDIAALDSLNERYFERFGFPFIIAVRHASAATLLAAITARIKRHRTLEIEAALKEIHAITFMRLLDIYEPAPTGNITVHCIDTALTRPAGGLPISLWQLGEDGRFQERVRFITTPGGGSAQPLLADGALAYGTYELRYDVATYFASRAEPIPAERFFREVVTRFVVTNPEESYHIPLHLSRGAFTSYRGS